MLQFQYEGAQCHIYHLYTMFFNAFCFSRESGFFRVIKEYTLPQIAMFPGLCDATELSVNEHVLGL